jgi:hypothetical protein
MMSQSGLYSEAYAASIQIERELETEDLVLLSQLRRAQRAEKRHLLPARGSIPYIAKPSLTNPGATIAVGR